MFGISKPCLVLGSLVNDDTGIILETIVNTKWYQLLTVLLGIGKPCLVLGSLVKVLSGIAKYCQVLKSFVRHWKELPCFDIGSSVRVSDQIRSDHIGKYMSKF